MRAISVQLEINMLKPIIKTVLKVVVLAILAAIGFLAIGFLATYLWLCGASIIWTNYGDNAFMLYLIATAIVLVVLVVSL